MPDKNACPACGANIGLVAVFKAPLPNRIFCPHCGERLRYRNSWWLVLPVVVVMLASAAAAPLTAALLGASGSAVGLLLLAHLVAAGGACEVAFVLLLWYAPFKLEAVNPPPPAWQDVDDF